MSPVRVLVTAVGHGFNINYPLPFGTDWDQYKVALTEALSRLSGFAPDAMVVALGLDTFAGDPTTHFGITIADFLQMGKTIAAAGTPTLTVLEGGYSVDHIGQNTVNFLTGIEDD